MNTLNVLLPCIAFIIIMFVAAVYINESWCKEYKKLDDKWSRYCDSLNRRIEELEKAVNKEESNND